MRNAFSIVLLFSTWIPTIILSFQSFQISLPFRSYVNPNSLNSYTFWYIQKNDTNYTIKAGIERLLAKEHENFVINYLSNVPIDPDSNIHFNLVELKYHFGNPKKLKMSYFLGNKKGSLHTQILPNFLRLKDVVHRGLTL